ncbi:MAG: hypothetical protein M1828_006687 [Chrysothrix sp. TS-e1954]|nr:MAG: hypothetical protein M1828_006687 [Chrysothrix sp. TS-e1954]
MAYRTKRVKDAKNEAQSEIEEYRKQKEDEFKKYEKEQSSGNKQAEDDANKETEEKLKEIRAVGDKGGDDVVKELLKAVTVVDPAPPSKS